MNQSYQLKEKKTLNICKSEYPTELHHLKNFPKILIILIMRDIVIILSELMCR